MQQNNAHASLTHTYVMSLAQNAKHEKSRHTNDNDMSIEHHNDWSLPSSTPHNSQHSAKRQTGTDLFINATLTFSMLANYMLKYTQKCAPAETTGVHALVDILTTADDNAMLQLLKYTAYD